MKVKPQFRSERQRRTSKGCSTLVAGLDIWGGISACGRFWKIGAKNLSNLPVPVCGQFHKTGLNESVGTPFGCISRAEEGLEFIKANNLFTGSWSHNRAKRRLRVAQILPFIAKTFNAALCTGVRHDINFGKFDAWAKKHCPGGWRRAGGSRDLDQFGTLIVRQRDRSAVEWQFVSIFLSLTEYLVLNDKNKDDSVPSNRAEALWTLLYDQGVISIPYCPRKWKIARDRLEKLGVLKIDHHYHRGQAMRWWSGTWFPGLGLWKQQKAQGLLEPVSLTEFLIGQRERTIHNTLLQQAIEENVVPRLFSGSGTDPPTIQQPIGQ